MREYTDDEDYYVEGFMEKANQNIRLNGNEKCEVTLKGKDLLAVKNALETLEVGEYKAKIRAMRHKLDDKRKKINQAYRARKEAVEELQRLQEYGGMDNTELINKIESLNSQIEIDSFVIGKTLEALQKIRDDELEDYSHAKDYADEIHQKALDKLQENAGDKK